MNKKVITILLVLFAIYGIIMFLLFGNKKEDNNNVDNNNETTVEEKDNNKYYLVLDNDSTWMYYESKWSKTNKTVIEKNNNYMVYDGNNLLGENKLVAGNVWNIFDLNNNYISHENSLFAYSTNFNIRLLRTNPTSISERPIIYSGKNLDTDNLLTNEVVNIDIDGNNQIDKIVVLSNNGLDMGNTSYYNLVYIELNGMVKVLISQFNDPSNLSLYNFNRVFELNNEKYIVIKETSNFIGDQEKVINHLYKLEDNTFKEIMSD